MNAEFLRRYDRLLTGIAVFTLTGSAFAVMCVNLVRGTRWNVTVNDLPVALRPLAYVVFAFCILGAFQVFDRLIPHALALKVPLWSKVAWVGALLFWPLGPAAYFVAVYARSIKAPESRTQSEIGSAPS